MKDTFSEHTIEWTVVDEYTSENTVSGMVMALLECFKMLTNLLNIQGYKGKNIYEKIAQARDRFSDLAGLSIALELREKIVEENDFHPDKNIIQTSIRSLRSAVNDISETEVVQAGTWEKLKSFLNYYVLYQKILLKKLLIGFVLLVVVIIILDVSHPGQMIVDVVIKIASGLFNVIFLIVLGGGIVLIVLFFVLNYFLKRQKKKKKDLDSI